MLESEIKKLAAAVEANTAALLGGATAAPEAVTSADATTEPVAAAAVGDIPLDDAPATAPATTAPATTAPVVAEAVTLKQITEGIVALCKAKGRESAAHLMAEYGAQKVPDLKKVSEKYGEILGKINALIESK